MTIIGRLLKSQKILNENRHSWIGCFWIRRIVISVLFLSGLLFPISTNVHSVIAGDFDGCTHNIWTGERNCPTTRLFGTLRNNINGFPPIREAIVEIWDADAVLHDKIGSTVTDASGYWELTFENFTDCTGGESILDSVHCPYPDDTVLENRRADVYIRALARNDLIADVFCPALVCPPLGGTWTYPSSIYGPNDVRQDIGDGDQCYGDSACITAVIDLDSDPNTPGEDDAFFVFENLRDAWRFIDQETGIEIPQVGVEFPCKGGLFGLPCPGRAFFDPYITHHIFLQKDNDRFVHIHEYGHYVMYKAYNDSWPASPEQQVGSANLLNPTLMATDCLFHSLSKAIPSECAWAEGWASFFAEAVMGTAQFEDTSSLDTGSTPGEVFEMLIAGTLLDILDTSDDGYDTFSASFEDIFNTLWAAGPGDCGWWNDPPVLGQCISNQRILRDFYRDWIARGLNPQVVNAAAFQNRINLNNAPYVVSISGAVDSTGSTISFMVVGADDQGGYVDGFISDAQFEYSLNGSPWSPIPQAMIQHMGSNTFSGTMNLSSAGFMVIRALVVDNLDTASNWRYSDSIVIQPPKAHSNGSSSYFKEGGYNAYAAFDVAVKYESGVAVSSGSLTFTSTRNRIKVVSTGIDILEVVGNSAGFSGTCTVNGMAGYSFFVMVEDKATPGAGADTFNITVGGPGGFHYSASGIIISGDYTVSR